MNDFIDSLATVEAASSQSVEQDDGWYTIKQINEQSDIGINRLRGIIKEGVACGVYEMKRFKASNINGHSYQVTKFRLVQNGE